jgi:hypothetical protein
MQRYRKWGFNLQYCNSGALRDDRGASRGGLDVEGREGAEDFVLQGRSPAVTAGQQRVAGGRADGRGRVAVGEAAAFGRQAVD